MKVRVCGLETEMLGSYFSGDENEDLISQDKITTEQIKKFLEYLREKFGKFQTFGFVKRAVLPNQGQVYIDMLDPSGGIFEMIGPTTSSAFLEICTPECSSSTDLVLHKRVSNEVVVRALREFNERLREDTGLPDAGLYFHHRASDNEHTGTCACHENYQGEVELKHYSGAKCVNSLGPVKRFLTPFLVARKLLEGSGLVYAYRNRGLSFCISQRLAFINKLWSACSTSRENRPMILFGGGRDEPLSFGAGASDKMKEEVKNFTRWQILSGEHNQSPFCDEVKVGSVRLLLEMIEWGYFRNKESDAPWFFDTDFYCGRLNNRGFFRKINKDAACQDFYWCRIYGHDLRMRLCDVLSVYADWMLDYLESYSSHERSGLYVEMFEVAKKIRRAADCFARGDIFALDEEIDWIIKLRWFQRLIKDEAGIEIDDNDFLKGAAGLNEMLVKSWGVNRLRNGISLAELSQKLFDSQTSWHQFDPESPVESDYRVLEDCGLVRPFSIAGRPVDLLTEKHMDSVPVSPPNRTGDRKKLTDFFNKINLAPFLYVDWTKGEINLPSSIDEPVSLGPLTFRFSKNVNLRSLLEKFLRAGVFHFYHPQKIHYPEVDEFIKWMSKFIELED